jgi:hypothetical protein
MSETCDKCGGPVESGVATAQGLIGGAVVPATEPRLVFVVPGTATSANPVTAFKQRLADERDAVGYAVRGRRCTRCGHLEFYATERTHIL